MNKYTYLYDQYLIDFNNLVKTILFIPEPINIVGIYRGGLPLATHLSNVLDCNMSIIKFQSRDSNDDSSEWIYNSIKENDSVVIVDDIFDTGVTFNEVLNNIKQFHAYDKIHSFALFGNRNDLSVRYLNEHNKRWIVFPWEHLK